MLDLSSSVGIAGSLYPESGFKWKLLMSFTQTDWDVLKASSQNINVFTGHYFGVTLMDSQVMMAHAAQPNILELGGRGSGKTFGFMFIYLWWACLVPDFRALWGSITADQAAIPYEELLPYVLDNPRFSKFLAKPPVKGPHPRITVKLPGLPESFIVFKTIGREAVTKRGFSLDVIHWDEGGQEYDDTVIATLRPALRGKRVDGSRRLGRLSVSTTPTSAEWLRRWWYRGADPEAPDFDPSRYLCVRVKTRDNIHLTEEEVQLMEEEMSEEERDVELDAMLPQIGANMFPISNILQCEVKWLNDVIHQKVEGSPEDGVQPDEEAYRDFHRKWGMLRYELPRVKEHRHLLAADAGTGNPPYRGAGAVMVFDISCKPAQMVALWWVAGNGRWAPWIAAVKYFLDKYQPEFKGIDSTGAQSAIIETEFQREGIPITGFHLGKRKSDMLIDLQMSLEKVKMIWPFIKGLREQLRKYRLPDKNMAQDLVMTLATAAYMLRDLPDEKEGPPARSGRLRKTRRKVRSRRPSVRAKSRKR